LLLPFDDLLASADCATPLLLSTGACHNLNNLDIFTFNYKRLQIIWENGESLLSKKIALNIYVHASSKLLKLELVGNCSFVELGEFGW